MAGKKEDEEDEEDEEGGEKAGLVFVVGTATTVL